MHQQPPIPQIKAVEPSESTLMNKVNRLEEIKNRKIELEKEHNQILESMKLSKNIKYINPKEENLIKFKNNIIKKVFNVDLAGGSGPNSNSSIETGKSNSSVETGKSNSSVETGKSNSSVEMGKSNSSVETGKSNSSVETGKSNSSVEIVEIRTPFENKLSILNHIKNNYDLTNKKKINVIFLNKENKPETLVVNTQMMKNYLKHTSNMTTNTTILKASLPTDASNKIGGNIRINYNLSYLIMQ
jgi:hypothetical protein